MLVTPAKLLTLCSLLAFKSDNWKHYPFMAAPFLRNPKKTVYRDIYFLTPQSLH